SRGIRDEQQITNRTYSGSVKKEGVLGRLVGVPETLGGSVSLESNRLTCVHVLLVLRDLVVCKFLHEIQTWLDLVHGLGLKEAGLDGTVPDGVTFRAPHKDCTPAVGAAHRTG